MARLMQMAQLIAYFSRAGENYFSGALRVVPVGNTEIAADRHLDPASCDYIYLGGGTLRMPPKCPILMEKPETHSRNQVNIVYADGCSEIIRLPETVTTVRELFEYLEKSADDPDVKAFLRQKRQTFFQRKP